MRSHIPAQTSKMNLIQGTEVQDPTGVLRHCQHSVLIGWLIHLFQVVPLSRKAIK